MLVTDHAPSASEVVFACSLSHAVTNSRVETGRVKVEVTVTPSGKLTSANATAEDSKLAACVADSAQRSSFPKQDGDRTVTLTYEVRFEDPGPADCPS